MRQGGGEGAYDLRSVPPSEVARARPGPFQILPLRRRPAADA